MACILRIASFCALVLLAVLALVLPPLLRRRHHHGELERLLHAKGYALNLSYWKREHEPCRGPVLYYRPQANGYGFHYLTWDDMRGYRINLDLSASDGQPPPNVTWPLTELVDEERFW
ncbi:MAG: hypothetical protein ACOCZK_05670 [Planctomycetota bacterium]